MDVKDAVAAAKKYVAELFGPEGMSNLGLEEVEFDEQAGEWRVTIGFSRPWDSVTGWAVLTTPPAETNPRRSYKVVRISDATGAAISVKRSELN